MLKMRLVLITIFFIAPVLGTKDQNTHSKWRYIHQYVPKESLVRERCKQEEKSFNIWPFKSKICRSCDYLNAELKYMDADKQPDYSYGATGFLGALLIYLALQRKAEQIREAVCNVLPESNDAVHWNECEHICHAISTVEKQRRERLSRTTRKV